LKIPPHRSIIAGVIAGAIEATITYPTEYVKTQLQLQSKLQSQIKSTLLSSSSSTTTSASASSAARTVIYKGPIDVLKHTIQTKGFFGLYRGLSALVIGTASKAGVRFLVFDQLKQLLATENKDGKGGKSVSGGRMMLAGLGAGVVEAVVAVTPTETIK
jgi:solute carrier family 25 citrate transporter 1